MQKIYLSAAAGAVLSALIGYFVLKGQFATDFVIFWSAHQVPNAYDVPALREAIVAAIGEERTPDTPWPFPYPPTFLLMTAWFGPLTLGAAYLAWLALSGGALVASARHPAAPLLLFSPWVIFALMAGQTAMLIGALILMALTHLDRPILAGVLLGVAACIKPQFVALVGLGLLFDGRWRAIAAMAATGAALALAATIAYGIGIWRAWLDLLPSMFVYTDRISYHLDLPGWPAKALALAIGLVLIWKYFREGSAADKALVAGATALLSMPHTLWYNSALVAPALFSAAIQRGLPAALAVGAMLLRPSSLSIAAATTWALAAQEALSRRTWMTPRSSA